MVDIASEPPLHRLAQTAGLARHWRDVDGCDRVVSDASLGAILGALGHKAETAAQIRRSLARLADQAQGLPPMLVGEAGLPTPLPVDAQDAELVREDGIARRIAVAKGALVPIDEPGYYDLIIGGQACKLAIAPRRCPSPAGRQWGTAVQIPALRSARRSDFGDFGALTDAVRTLGRAGCDALAINPVHALFPGFGEDFSPYSPSSRIHLNTAMGDPALLGLPPLPESEGEEGPLIDWPSALPRRLAALRQTYAALGADMLARIAADCDAEGPGLTLHATFDALDVQFRARWRSSWQAWPAAYRRADSAEVARFAQDNAAEVGFHRFAQWLSRQGLDAAQQAAREAGMGLGLIADLAVGVSPGGSDAWAMPQAMLRGLTIGAPPDPLGPLGQNWSITGFAPGGLSASGYAPWIAMLRSALRSAGGLRIDHAYGLARLWVIPDGGDSSQGAYLSYPFMDLARLVTLEAHLANALIIAEDLGTAPPGFTHAVSQRGMLGMRVLWFERAEDNGYIGAQDYPADCTAMTGTHDTATVAGWWTGRDLDWAEALGRLPADVSRAKAEEIRDWDRGLLWSTIGGAAPRPAPDDPAPACTAALHHVAQSPAALVIAPLEDLLAEPEQPNLPGTVTDHPNWRRRLAAPLAALLADPATAERVRVLSGRN